MPFTLPTNIDARPVAVVGAGTLGRRIALMLADRGGTVRIYDPSTDTTAAAVAFANERLPAVATKLDGGKTGSVEAAGTLDAALANAWLVVEAVPERLDLKRSVFADLDRLSAPDAILASNSSSYPTRMFTEGLAHPERILNLHFYMPPEQPAIDLMSDGKTDRGVIDFLLKTLPAYGIYPFEARQESTGFIFNRIWAAIKRESLEVVAEGVATPQEVDEMWKLNTHSKMGPFQQMDHVGLDVVLDIEDHYAAENRNLPEGPRKLLHTYVDAGKLGVKSGEGFYDYRDV